MLAVAELAREPGGKPLDLRAAGRAVLDRHPLLGASLSPTRRATRAMFAQGLAILLLGVVFGGSILRFAAFWIDALRWPSWSAQSSVSILTWVICGWAAFNLTINRLHDLGRSGFWALAPGLAAVALVLIEGSVRQDKLAAGVLAVSMLLYFCLGLALLILSGQPSANRFGPVPPEPPSKGAAAQV